MELRKATMRRPILIAAMIASLAGAAFAQIVHVPYAYAEDGIDQHKADAFDINMFTRPPGGKAFACFMRRYDAQHLAQHPKQKTAAMMLLVGAEIPEGETATAYSFNLGVKFRRRAGSFDSEGYCKHATAEDDGNEMRFACGVDCDGGGINVALSKDNASAIVRLDRVRLWKQNSADEDANLELEAGSDDQIFRLDRVDNAECSPLVSDRQELAALRQK